MKRNIKITVDAIILRQKNKEKLGLEEQEIVLIQRKNPPFKGKFALPGGFVKYGEKTEEACIREAKEETNIDIEIKKLIGVYSDPNRDPRGHTITITYLTIPKTNNEPIGKDDAQTAKYFKIKEVLAMQLAFDHKKMIQDFLKIYNF